MGGRLLTELEGRVGRDLALLLGAVGRGGRASDDSLRPDLEPHQTLVPPLDDLPLAEPERELSSRVFKAPTSVAFSRSNVHGNTYGFAGDVLVKDRAVGELADVPHLELLALLRDGALARRP